MELDILVRRSSVEIKKTNYFPLLIYKCKLDLPIEAMARDLEEIHDQTIETHDTTHGFNHQRGLIEGIESYDQFRSECLHAAYEFATDHGWENKINPIFESWSNIHEQGTHHGWHLHPRCTVSGTFYLRTNNIGIKFLRPDQDKRMHHGPGTGEWGALDVELFPEPGEMFIWPSYVMHMVDTQQEPGRKRISLSWNVDYNR